jgi:hypothetical protein
LRIICKVLSHKVTKNLADNTTFLAINRLIINQLDTFSVNPKYANRISLGYLVLYYIWGLIRVQSMLFLSP